MRKRPSRVYLYVRLDPELIKRIHQRAQSEDRSLRSVVSRLLEAALSLPTASDTQPVRDHA